MTDDDLVIENNEVVRQTKEKGREIVGVVERRRGQNLEINDQNHEIAEANHENVGDVNERVEAEIAGVQYQQLGKDLHRR